MVSHEHGLSLETYLLSSHFFFLISQYICFEMSLYCTIFVVVVLFFLLILFSQVFNYL